MTVHVPRQTLGRALMIERVVEPRRLRPLYVGFHYRRWSIAWWAASLVHGRIALRELFRRRR